MTDPFGQCTYKSENDLDLYHLFVDEFESKIIDGHLNVGTFRLRIRYNNYHEIGDDKHKCIRKEVGYLCQGDVPRIGSFRIQAVIRRGYLPQLQINHGQSPGGIFCFPFNDVIFKEEPLLCFNKWMEIAVNRMPTLDPYAEYDRFIHIKKQTRHFKKK